jgi:hypothetical protein
LILCRRLKNSWIFIPYEKDYQKNIKRRIY